MAKSDVSGAPIEPDAPETVVAVFPDGTRRRLTVTSAEATTLRKRGTDETTWLGRARAFLTAKGGKLLFWALGLFVASLAIPAATRQLEDHQHATTLKGEIISAISKGSAEAFAESKNILEADQNDLPQRRLDARKAWEVTQAEVDARYAVYFDKHDPARRAWSGYRDAVYTYVSTLCCDRFLDKDVALLRDYLAGLEQRPFEGSKDPWEVLRCGDDRRCATATEFAEAHKWLGLALLRKRGAVLDELRRAEPEGFSRGWGDFVDDVIPVGD
jgi:hypothetical protein